jgi:hypothetical protein
MSVSSCFRFTRIDAVLGLCLLAFANHSYAAESVISTSHTTAPAPLKQALQSAWRNHPNSRITDALLNAARARADAASRPL